MSARFDMAETPSGAALSLGVRRRLLRSTGRGQSLHAEVRSPGQGKGASASEGAGALPRIDPHPAAFNPVTCKDTLVRQLEVSAMQTWLIFDR